MEEVADVVEAEVVVEAAMIEHAINVVNRVIYHMIAHKAVVVEEEEEVEEVAEVVEVAEEDKEITMEGMTIEHIL